MAIAGQVIDFYDDINREGLTKVAGLDRYGDTHVLEPEELASLPDSSFGLIVLTKHANIIRKFPINDEGNVWLSASYFDQNHQKLATNEKVVAASNIKVACLAHELPVSPVINKFALDQSVNNVTTEGTSAVKFDELLRKQAESELSKTASVEIDARMNLPDGSYALVLDHDGDVVRKYAMPDADHVKIASAYFDKYAMALNPEHRHQFASNVLRRAEELGVDLKKTAHLETWASERYNDHVDWHLEARKSLLPQNSPLTEAIDKLASMRTDADPAVFSQALHEFDKQAGLTKYYDSQISDPWKSVMGEEKVASWHTEIDGEILTSSELQKIAGSDKLRSHFGSTFQEQFKKHAVEIFESLPKPERVIIKQIAKGQI